MKAHTHTHAETRFRPSVIWTSPFKSAGTTVQSTTAGSQGVRVSGVALVLAVVNTLITAGKCRYKEGRSG